MRHIFNVDEQTFPVHRDVDSVALASWEPPVDNYQQSGATLEFQ